MVWVIVRGRGKEEPVESSLGGQARADGAVRAYAHCDGGGGFPVTDTLDPLL
jgi:hypothetical protein